MTTNVPTLKGVKRERTGSRYARRARQQGLIPAVLYGHGQEPLAIAVPSEETLHFVRGGDKVFTLEIDGEEADTCLLKALQYDHLGSDIVHLDLARVSLDERVEVHVPVHFIGDAVGLKEAGAILEKLTTSITIECRVTNIPEFINLDISGLESGSAVHAGDVVLPGAEMVLLSEADTVLARIEVRLHKAEDTETEEGVEGVEGVEGAEGAEAGGETEAPKEA